MATNPANVNQPGFGIDTALVGCLFLIMLLLSGCGSRINGELPISPSSTNELTSVVPLPAETRTSSPVDTVTPPAPVPGIGSLLRSDKDGAALVYVPEGEFLMGSSDEPCDTCKGSPSYLDNKPQHTVRLNAFWIDQTEVTNKLYSLCVSAGACTPPASIASPTRSSYYRNPKFDLYPVVNIEWDQASQYCSWAGRRLPTEAEWEKAARGENGYAYPWGNDPPNDRLLNYNSPSRDTTEVGHYPDGQSPYGAYDMAGNVWEWVNDRYDENYYQVSPAVNPLGPDSDLQKSNSRVLRGGSWYYADGSFRSIFRFGVVPVDYLVRSDVRSWALQKYEETSIYGRSTYGLGTVGFRCAMDANP